MSRYLVRAHGMALLVTLTAVLAYGALLGHQNIAGRLLYAAIAFCALGGWRSASRRASTAMALLRDAENASAARYAASLARRPVELAEGTCTCHRCQPGEASESDHPAMTTVVLLTEHIETPGIRNIRKLTAAVPEGAPWHTAS